MAVMVWRMVGLRWWDLGIREEFSRLLMKKEFQKVDLVQFKCEV